jgi:hypothetical protein
MPHDDIRQLLEQVRAQALSVDDAIKRLKLAPIEELPYARVDAHRRLRCGFPEVIFCQGKTPEQVGGIAQAILGHSPLLLATRATPEHHRAVLAVAADAEYHQTARAITVRRDERRAGAGLVLVICAGTSDIPVAEEARVTAEMLGSRVETIYDAGVAGIHRLLQKTERIFEARAIVVAAGMEGALASVVGGLSSVPVIAVPTSIGYGASFGGLAPLLTMLNSCAAGVSVVNIDNGFGAGYIAALINRRGEPERQ